MSLPVLHCCRRFVAYLINHTLLALFDDNGNECTVCFGTSSPLVLYKPCNHRAVCSSCTARVSVCPSCRSRIDTTTPEVFRSASLKQSARVSLASAAAADFRAYFAAKQTATHAADPTAPLKTGDEMLDEADDSATDEIVAKLSATYNFPDVASTSTARLVVHRPTVAQVVRDLTPCQRGSIMALESLKSAAAARTKEQRADKTYAPNVSELESALETTSCDESDFAIPSMSYMSTPMSPAHKGRQAVVCRPRYRPAGLHTSAESGGDDDNDASVEAKRARHADRRSRKAQAMKQANRLERRQARRARHPTAAIDVNVATEASSAFLMPPPPTVPKLHLSVPRLVYTSTEEDEAVVASSSSSSSSSTPVVVISDSESDSGEEAAVMVTVTDVPKRRGPNLKTTLRKVQSQHEAIDSTINAVIADFDNNTPTTAAAVVDGETAVVVVVDNDETSVDAFPMMTDAADRRAFLTELRTSSKKNAAISAGMDTDAERTASRSLDSCGVIPYIRAACKSTRTAPTTDFDSDSLIDAMNTPKEQHTQQQAERMAQHALHDASRPEANRRQYLRATRIPQSSYATTPKLRRTHMARCRENAARGTCSICRRDLDATLVAAFTDKATQAADRLANAVTSGVARSRVDQYMAGAGTRLEMAEKEAYDRRQIAQADVPSMTQCCSLPLCGSCIRAWIVNHELHTTCLVKNRGRLLDRLPRCVVCNEHGKDSAMIGSADVAAACETSLSMRALRHLEFRGANGAKCAFVVRSAITGGH